MQSAPTLAGNGQPTHSVAYVTAVYLPILTHHQRNLGNTRENRLESGVLTEPSVRQLVQVCFDGVCTYVTCVVLRRRNGG